MKIALIIWRLNIRGGSQKQLLYLANELISKGHDITIYTCFFNRRSTYYELLDRIRSIKFLYNCTIEEEKKIYDEVLNTRKLAPYPRFIKWHLIENKLCLRLSELIEKDTDILHPHDMAVYKTAAFYKMKVKNIPSVYMCNDVPSLLWMYERLEKKINIIKKFILWLIDRLNSRMLAANDTILVLDDFNRKALYKYFGLKGFVIRSGAVCYEDIVEHKMNGIPLKYNSINLLMISVIDSPHRRIEDSINALRIILDNGYKAELNIVGKVINQVYFNKLIDLVKNLNLTEYVKFHGQLDDEELKSLLKKCHVFIFPNHNQTWGLAVLDAMGSGIPVILSKTAGVAEILTDRLHCLKVEPKSPTMLAKLTIELINNQELYFNIIKNAYHFLKSEITWSKFGTQIENYLISHLKSKRE